MGRYTALRRRRAKAQYAASLEPLRLLHSRDWPTRRWALAALTEDNDGPVQNSYDILISNATEMRAFNPNAARALFPAANPLIVAFAPGIYNKVSPSDEVAWTYPSGATSSAGNDITFIPQYQRLNAPGSATKYDTTYQPLIDSIEWKGSPYTVTFRGMWLACLDWEGNPLGDQSPNGNGAWRDHDSTGPGYAFDDCDFSGNYRGDPYFRFDKTNVLYQSSPSVIYENRYPECAAIFATIVGKVITDVFVSTGTWGNPVEYTTINHYIGDNYAGYHNGVTLPDGTYPLTTQSSTGSGFTGEMDVVNGRITAARVLTGGSNYNDQGNVPVTWAGQQRMAAYLPSGALRPYGGAAATTGLLSVTGCRFQNNSYSSLRITPHGGLWFYNNDVQQYADGMLWSNSTPPPTTLKAYFNFIHSSWGAATDPNAPHADSAQLNGGTSVTPYNSPVYFEYIGNIFESGVTRQSQSGILFTKLTGYDNSTGAGGYIMGNYFLLAQQGNGCSVQHTRDLMIFENVNCRWNYLDTAQNTGIQAGTQVVNLTNDGVGNAVNGNIVVGRTITDALSIVNNAQYVDTSTFPNLITGDLGATIAYPAVFASPASQPVTYTDTVAAFATIGAYTGYGPGASGAYDYVNKTIDWSKIPRAVTFPPLFGQAIGVDLTSAIYRIMGGSSTGTATFNGDAGGQFQIFDDYLGNGGTGFVTSYSGAMRDKFIQFKIPAIATGTTFKTASAVDETGRTFASWMVCTAPASPFVKVDNQAAAYSDAATGTGLGTATRIMMGAFFQLDAALSTANLNIGTGNTQSFRLSGSQSQVQLGTSGNAINRKLVLTPDTGADMLWVVQVDFTQAINSAARFKWMANTTLLDTTIPVAESNSANPFNMDTAITSVYRLFANAAASAKADIRPSMFYLWWGTSALPSMATLADRRALYASFSADNIGATGTGPMGTQPQLCYYGALGNADGSTPNSWNATGGLTNRGTLTAPLIKQAGTYVLG